MSEFIDRENIDGEIFEHASASSVCGRVDGHEGQLGAVPFARTTEESEQRRRKRFGGKLKFESKRAYILDLRLCSWILNVPNKKNRCVILSNRNDHPINTIHPAYHITFPLCVYANVLIFVPMLPPFLPTICLLLILSLYLR